MRSVAPVEWPWCAVMFCVESAPECVLVVIFSISLPNSNSGRFERWGRSESETTLRSGCSVLLVGLSCDVVGYAAARLGNGNQ